MSTQEPAGDIFSDARMRDPIWEGVLLLSSLVLLFALLFNHYQIVTSPYPIDYYESAMPAITQTIAQGNNPYARAQLPEATNTYTPLYNLIALPFAKVFGNTLQVHRLLSGLFILGTCLLVYWVVYLACRLKIMALAAATSLYGVLLYYATPIASTNSTGLFFFIACVLLPWVDNYSRRSLFLSLLSGILAFFGKQYFLIGLGFVALQLFLAISKKMGINYALAGIAVLASSLIIVFKTSPYFFDTTVLLLHNGGEKYSSDALLYEQLKFFFEIYWPLIILAVIGFGYGRLTAQAPDTPSFRSWNYNLRELDRPLITPEVNYFLLCFVCATIAILMVLGKNIGNYMSYHFQLMSPFLVLYLFTLYPKLHIPGFVLVPLILVNFYLVYEILPQDFDVNPVPWKKIEKYIDTNERILASPVVTSLLIDRDRDLYHRTMSYFFHEAEKRPEILVRENEEDTIGYIYDKYMNDLHQKIETHYFEVLILSKTDIYYFFGAYPNPQNTFGSYYLNHYYKVVDKVPLYLTDRYGGGIREMIVWKPRKEHEMSGSRRSSGLLEKN